MHLNLVFTTSKPTQFFRCFYGNLFTGCYFVATDGDQVLVDHGSHIISAYCTPAYDPNCEGFKHKWICPALKFDQPSLGGSLG